MQQVPSTHEKFWILEPLTTNIVLEQFQYYSGILFFD